jgi:hypothetical protein
LSVGRFLDLRSEVERFDFRPDGRVEEADGGPGDLVPMQHEQRVIRPVLARCLGVGEAQLQTDAFKEGDTDPYRGGKPDYDSTEPRSAQGLKRTPGRGSLQVLLGSSHQPVAECRPRPCALQ